MKDDLTKFEKDILKNINNLHGTKYDYRNLMEWSSSKEAVEKNLEEGEKIYKSLGMFVSIKPTK